MPGYDAAVAADSPTHWWKFGDASGTTYADSGSGARPLTLNAGTITLGQAGIPGSAATAALFAAGAAAWEGGAVYAAPTSFSMECWFKSTVAGASGSFGSSTAPIVCFGRSSSFDKQIGLVTGKVNGYCYPNQINSPAAYNDGNWHHVVLTMTTGNAGVAYVDGAQVATGTLGFSSFSDLWAVGASYSGSLFAGTVAHVAVYEGVVLTPTQVSTHYNGGLAAGVNGVGTGAIAFGGSGTAKVTSNATGTGAIAFAASGLAKVTSNGTGSGAIVFGGSGTAAVGGQVPATGTGAIVFAASGTAKVTVAATGTGAIAFAGSGTATATGQVTAAGTGAIAFAASGTAAVTGPPTPLPPEVVLPPSAPRPRAVWRWVIGPWYLPPQRELTLATARKITFNLTAPATATFSLPGRSDEAGDLAEMLTDVWVYRDTRLVFRGRVINVADTVGADTHTLAVDCVDYRGLLTRRLLVEGDQLNWSTPTYADIAWGLVALTQNKPNGGLGIIQGTWQPDAAQAPTNYRVRNYQAGAEIGVTLDDLAGVAFDYQIDAGLNMNLWAPDNRFLSGFVADYGGTVVAFTRSATATTWANVVRVSGAASSTVGDVVFTQTVEGRFEQQVGYPDVVLQATIDQRSIGDADRWLVRRAAINLDLRPGVVGAIDDISPGAQIPVSLTSGRLSVGGIRTVQSTTIALDDTGVAHVTLGLLVNE